MSAATGPEIVADVPCLCGEGPLWHPVEKVVYWVDIPKGTLYRWDPATRRHGVALQTGVLGGYTVQEDGGLLLFMERGAVALWKDGALRTLIASTPGEENGRFNDVVADPSGRVFCGTLPADGHKGSLYRLDADLRLHKVVAEQFDCANGMGFTPDRRGMYFVDSPAREVTWFDYDEQSGALSGRRTFARLPEGLGVGDGMTVDAEGFVWVAVWGGSCLVRFTPGGREDRRISFPAKLVSSVTFGGELYEDMYVTTAGGDNRAENGPSAGALFHLRPGVRGVPEYRSRVRAW